MLSRLLLAAAFIAAMPPLRRRRLIFRRHFAFAAAFAIFGCVVFASRHFLRFRQQRLFAAIFFAIFADYFYASHYFILFFAIAPPPRIADTPLFRR